MKKIAVLDWGIGGFAFVRALRRAGHRTTVLYFSDSGMTPYGLQDPQTLHKRLEKVISWCRSKGCEGIVVACNAASSVLQPAADVCGVIQPTIKAMRMHSSRYLHVIGGERTIDSGIFQKAFPYATFQVAQPLSALIERGDMAGVSQILPRLLNSSQKELLCACTHYEAIESLYYQNMPALQRIYLPSHFTLSHLVSIWRLEHGEEPDTFYSSGDCSDAAVVKQVFGISWSNPIQQIIE